MSQTIVLLLDILLELLARDLQGPRCPGEFYSFTRFKHHGFVQSFKNLSYLLGPYRQTHTSALVQIRRGTLETIPANSAFVYNTK